MKQTVSKKLISFVLALVLVVSCVVVGCISVLADDSVSYDFDSSTGILTISGTGAMDDYDEDTVADCPWYADRADVRTVIVQEGITHIGSYTFCREINLTSVSLPESLQSIGSAAFAGTDNLKSITVPDSVTEIGSCAFGFDYNMELTRGFVVYCGANSTAQTYCLANYIPFDTAFVPGASATAVILGSNWQAMWSFVPAVDGVITFSSTGTFDTFGLIYDFEDYVYSTVFNDMKKSAIATNDDNESDCNFCVTYHATAGKRYYLAAKFRSAGKTSGSFGVNMTFDCDEHSYAVTANTATCLQGGIVDYRCIGCGEEYSAVSDALGHDYALTEKLPTCTEDGFRTYTCNRCGDEYTDVLDRTGHTSGDPRIENYVPATCTSDGSYNSVVYCTVCGDVVSNDAVVVKKLQHDYRPVDFADGVVGMTCIGCNDYHTVDFNTYLNTKYAPLDIVTDGIVNAKDYARFAKEYPAPTH